MPKDVLTIKKSSNIYNECYKTLKVSPSTHEKVKKIAEQINRNINEIATMLVNLALERVEVEEE
jgi:hypothetical protein